MARFIQSDMGVHRLNCVTDTENSGCFASASALASQNRYIRGEPKLHLPILRAILLNFLLSTIRQPNPGTSGNKKESPRRLRDKGMLSVILRYSALRATHFRFHPRKCAHSCATKCALLLGSKLTQRKMRAGILQRYHGSFSTALLSVRGVRFC